MKITKKIAAATLGPAAVAGITVASLAVASQDQPANAASSHPITQADQRHTAQTVRVHQAMFGGHKMAGTTAASVNQARPARQATQAPAQHRTAATSPTSMFAGMSSFERCVAWRESGNNPAASSAGLFGILPSTWASLGYPGTAGTSSVALQKQAFSRLYAAYGTSPWAPYDGC
ncbi:MAG: hypothetical protein LBV34_23105 [Nocardiopsaceae bacterium]|jgi:hypothetical protein|nr:hypothetical protein [Nocardiopsaceae bacterium]